MKRLYIALILIGLVVALPAAALAQGAGAPKGGDVTVRLVSNGRNGETVASASFNCSLAIGENCSRSLHSDRAANVTGTGEPTPEVIARMEARSGRPMRVELIWKVQIKVLSAEADAVTFDVQWQRLDVSAGEAQQVGGDARTLTLRKGQHPYVLDFRNTESADAKVVSQAVELEASPVEDPAFADVAFSYDVWLVHNMPDGQRITRRIVVSGRHGESVPFRFPPMKFGLFTGLPADDASGPIALAVEGKIIGRMRADGTVDVTLQPIEKLITPTGSIGGGAGEKSYNAQINQLVSVEFPPESGRAGFSYHSAPRPDSPKPGVTVGNGTVSVDYKAFFAGTNTSMMITVSKQPVIRM